MNALNLNISANDLEELISKSNNLVLIDVRTITEFHTGHIKNAINIPVDTLTVDKIETLINKMHLTNPMLIIYCHSGIRSANFINKLSADDKEVLESLDCTLYNLQGGIVTIPSNLLTME